MERLQLASATSDASEADITLLPAELHGHITEAVWQSCDARDMGRLLSVCSAFRIDSYVARMREEESAWLRQWVRVDGLPCAPLPTHARRVWVLHGQLHDMLSRVEGFMEEQKLPIEAYYIPLSGEQEQQPGWTCQGHVYVQMRTRSWAEVLLEELSDGRAFTDCNYIYGRRDPFLRAEREALSFPSYDLRARAVSAHERWSMTSYCTAGLRLAAVQLQVRCTDTTWEKDGGLYIGPRMRSVRNLHRRRAGHT
jgi:hypothetical protein